LPAHVLLSNGILQMSIHQPNSVSNVPDRICTRSSSVSESAITAAEMNAKSLFVEFFILIPP